MEKIESVFPRTLDCWGADRAAIVPGFAEACPPVTSAVSKMRGNFMIFLRRAGGESRPSRHICPMSRPASSHMPRSAPANAASHADSAAGDRAAGAIRRHPDVVLLRCGYDIRPILEGCADDEPPPAERDTLLAVAMPPGARRADGLRTVRPISSSCSRCSTIGPIQPFFEDTPELDELIAELARAACSRCAGENLHHRQVSADPGRRQHADLLDRARPCGARPRGSRRDQCQGGAAAVSHAHAAAGLEALRGDA